MSTPMRVLIIEDQVADSELMLHELRRAGFAPDWQRVDSEPDYLSALETNPDLILADWSLPQFSGLRALQLLRERGLDFPFIIISGSIGEEAAVEAIRQGAADYLLKDRPARLGSAVEHALHEKRLRDEKRQAGQTLYDSEQKFRSFVEQSEDATILTDEEGTIIEWNRGAERIFGLPRIDVLGRFLWDIQFQTALPQQKKQLLYEQLKTITLDALKTGQGSWLNHLTDMTLHRSDGAHLTIQTMAFAIPTEIGFRLGSISRDITERKQAEEALRDSEIQYRRLFEAAKDGILILDANTGQIIDVNPFLVELLGYSFEEFQGKKVWEVGLFKNIASSKAAFVRLRKKGYIRYEDLPLEAKGGKQIAVEFVSNVYQVDHRRVVQCNIRDITERKRMERAMFLMSDTQRQITHLDDITDIYRLVGQKVLELIESGYVAVTMLDEQAQAMKVVGFYGLGSFYEKLVRTFKIDPSTIPYPLKDMSDDELHLFRSGRLEKFEGGLYNILVRKVPRHICNAIERELNLTSIYTMSFAWQGTYLGGLTLLPKHDISPYKDMIETIMNQASIAIKRLRSEEALRQSEESLRQAQQVAHMGSWAWHIQTNSLEWSDEMYHIFGIEKDTFSGELSEVIERAIHPDDRAEVEQSNLSVARDKKPIPLEYRVIRPDGTVRTVWAEAGDLILDEAGKPAILTGIAQDITGRKRMEEALNQSEALFHSLVESLPQNVFSKDLQGRFTFANQHYCVIEGKSLGAILGKTDFDLHPPELASKYQDDDRRVIETGQVLDMVEEHQPLGGDKFYVQVIKAPLYDGKGKVAGILGIFWDITEHKRAEEALRMSEERFRALIENSSDAIALLDANGIILFESQSASRILGYSRAELTGHLAFDLVNPDDLEKVTGTFAALLESPISVDVQFRLKHKDGSWRWVEAIVTNMLYLPAVQAIVINYRDVTERNQAEEALRESEDRYRLLVETLPDGVVVHSQGRIIFANPASATIIGAAGPADLIEKSVIGFVQPDKRELALKRIQQSLSEGVPVPSMEEKFVRLDGTPIDVELSGFPLSYAGKPATLSVFSDITARKRAEEALRESEDRYRLLVETLPDGVIVHSQGRVIFANPASATIIGAAGPADLIEKSVIEFVHPDYREMALKRIQQSLREGVPTSSAEEKFVRQDGSPVDVEVSGIPFSYAGKPAMLTVFNDITARKRAEEELMESKAIVDAVVENVPFMLFLKEAIDLRFVIFNRAGEELLGYDRKALLGKNNLDLFPPEQAAHFMAKDREVLDGEEGMLDIPEEPILTAKKGERLLHTRKICIRGADGTTKYLLGISEDITERKRAEEALRLSEEKYHTLVDEVNDGFYITDKEGVFTLANPAMARIYGFETPQALVGRKFMDFIAPERLAELSESVRSTMHTERAPEVINGQIVRPDGTRAFVEVKSAPLVKDGRMVGAQGVVRDITERKQAEETLHILSSRQEAILAAIPDILMEVDTNKVYTWANPAGFEFFGEDIVGKEAAFYFEGEQDTYDQVDALFNGSENLIYLESWQRRKDGEKRLLAWLCQVLKHTDGNVSGALSSAHDITERKRAEDALTQRASQLLLLNDIGRRVASVMDLDELLDTTASLIHESFGYAHVGIFITDKQQEGDLIMKARAGLYASRFHADHRLKLGQGMIGWVALYGKKLLANDVSTEMRFYDPFGDGLIKAELSVPIRAELGNVGVIDIQSRQLNAFSENDVMVMETLADVLSAAIHNARLYQELETYSSVLEQAVKERTEELGRTKDHIEAIFNSVGEAIIVFGTDGRVQQVNPAFEQITGYRAHEVEMHHYDDPQVAMGLSDDIFRQALELRGGHGWHGEMQVRRCDGTTFDSAVSISPVLDAQDTLVAFVGAMRDISLLKEVERLKDAFVSNVSHELRTPITSLKLLHHLLEVNPPKQSSYLEQLGRVIDRLNVLIEDMLRLSRLDQGRVEMNIAPVNLNALVTQYTTDLTLLAESKQLALIIEASSSQPTVQADGGLLGQALSVLLTNALNYTPAGGQIVVSTLTSEQEGQLWAGFSVSDTGPGISAEEQQMLFQRFFRGSVGQASGAPGTGLGLAIAREIIMRHGGRLAVESKGIPGEGAVFTVWLPVKNKTTDKLEEE